MNMKYFKSKDDEVFAYAADGSEDSFILPGLVQINAEELAKIRERQAAATPDKTRAEVEVARLVAYANPVTGSDRFGAEAVAARLSGDNARADAAEAALLARRKEIAAQNPWPIKGKK